MTDRFWLVGLLVISIGCLCGLFVAAAFGESREQCVAVNNTQAIIVEEGYDGFDVGNCNWIANEIILKGDYQLNAFTDKAHDVMNLWVFLKGGN